MDVASASVTVPLWLFASEWVLLFALGWLIIVMYRQVAYFQKLSDAGSERDGLALGEQAPSFDQTPVNWGSPDSTRFEPKGRWRLLVFADPGCVSCQDTLRALDRLTPTWGAALDTLVVTSAETGEIAAVEAFQTRSVAISRVRRDVAAQQYRTNVTPFAYLIEPGGTIKAKAVGADEGSLVKLARMADSRHVDVALISPR